MFRSQVLSPLDSALEVFFQPNCLGCGYLGTSLCFNCSSTFSSLRPPWCDRCGEPTEFSVQECGRCIESPVSWERRRALAWLDPVSLQIIHRIKFLGEVEWLSFLMDRDMSASPFEIDSGFVLVPIPLHWQRYFDRGFNQSEILCRYLSKKWKIEVENRLLQKRRSTDPQSTLKSKERQSNLKGAFQVMGDIPIPEKVILIDDICTTGATFETCSQVLKRAGVKEIYCWSLFQAARSMVLERMP